MLTLSNGYSFEFCCAAGALGFDGRGYWWDKPYLWTGRLRPEDFTIITKSVTLYKNKGEYRWYKWWKTFSWNKVSVWNKLGLPNPGIQWWIQYIYPNLRYNTILSLAPRSSYDAMIMAQTVNELKKYKLKGIEVNLSCPNTYQTERLQIVEQLLKHSTHPLILKIGVNTEYRPILDKYGDKIAAVDAINSVPLMGGGVSGPVIAEQAETVLKNLQVYYPKIPVISGGGIHSLNCVKIRFKLGASAVSIGSLFFTDASSPNRIVKECYNGISM